MAYRLPYRWVPDLVRKQIQFLGLDHDPNPPLNLEDIPPSGGVTEELGASSAGASASSGLLTRARAVTGTSTGASGESAALTRARAVTGASAGTATSSGSVSRARGLTGTSTGAGTSAGQVTRTKALSGTSVGTSASSGVLTGVDDLSGVSVGGSVSDAGLVRTLALTGTSAGSGVSATTGLDVSGPPKWSPAISTPGVGDIAALQFMLRDAAQEEELAAAYVAALVLL